jgi:hypothetical protein
MRTKEQDGRQNGQILLEFKLATTSEIQTRRVFLKQVVIENPILNSPYREPGRHWKFEDYGISDQVVDERRISSYFVSDYHVLDRII